MYQQLVDLSAQVLQAMRLQSLQLNVYHCSSVVSAYEKALGWDTWIRSNAVE